MLELCCRQANPSITHDAAPPPLLGRSWSFSKMQHSFPHTRTHTWQLPPTQLTSCMLDLMLRNR